MTAGRFVFVGIRMNLRAQMQSNGRGRGKELEIREDCHLESYLFIPDNQLFINTK